MDNSTRHKLIDDFILDRLDHQERTRFMTLLENDNALKEELEIRKMMVDQLKTIGNIKLKDRLLKIQSSVENEEEAHSGTKEEAQSEKAEAKIVGKRRFLRIAMAAAAMLLLLVVAFQFLNTELNNQELFANNYEAYELPFNNRAETTDQLLTQAGTLYQQEKYAEALPQLQQLIDDGKGDDRIKLALGICHLELKNYDKAITVLKQASNQEGFLYQDQAQWYTALAYLQLDKVTESKSLLQQLVNNPKAYFNKQAQQLLNLLK